MDIVLMILPLFALPCVFASVWNKKTGETVCMSLGIMMLFLFVFYCLDRLFVGFLLLHGLLAGAYLFSAVWVFRKKCFRRFAGCFFSHGFFAALLLILIIHFHTREFFPWLWDELRLWAAFPKVLYMTDHLQLGPDSLMFKTMKNYLPGLGLLDYFFQRIHGAYSEPLMYLIHGFLGASAFLPAVEKLKKAYAVPLTAGIIFLFPLCFYNSIESGADYYIYYRSLFIDGLLGLMFAYSLYCALDCSHEERVFTSARYVLSICTLMLIKESGLLLSGLSLIIFVLCHAPDKKAAGRQAGRIWKPVLLSVGCMLGIKLAWSRLLKVYAVQATGDWLSWEFLSSLLFHPTQEQTASMGQYLSILCQRSLFEAPWSFWGTMSWVKMLILALLVTCTFSLILRESKTIRALCGAICANVLYAASLMVQYVYWQSFSSYVRYINTGWIAVFAFLFMVVLHAWERPKEKSRQVWFRSAVIYSLLLAVLIFPLTETQTNSFADCHAEEHEYAEKVTAAVNRDQPGRKQRDLVNVFLLSDGSVNQVLHHHQLYNQLLTEGIAIRNWCYDTCLDPFRIPVIPNKRPTDPDEEYLEPFEGTPAEYLAEKLLHAPTGTYDYLYVANIPEKETYLYDLYSDIFMGGIEEHRLYRITYDSGNVVFHALP